jgi:hypothetical protein
MAVEEVLICPVQIDKCLLENLGSDLVQPGTVLRVVAKCEDFPALCGVGDIVPAVFPDKVSLLLA